MVFLKNIFSNVLSQKKIISKLLPQKIHFQKIRFQKGLSKNTFQKFFQNCSLKKIYFQFVIFDP